MVSKTKVIYRDLQFDDSYPVCAQECIFYRRNLYKLDFFKRFIKPKMGEMEMSGASYVWNKQLTE